VALRQEQILSFSPAMNWGAFGLLELMEQTILKPLK
jgi:hypothetical protein